MDRSSGTYKIKCNNKDCGITFDSLKKDKAQCTECKFSIFKKYVKDERKKYELSIEDFLEKNNYNYSYDENISTDYGKERFRPDFLFYRKTHFIVLEVDENEHKGYKNELVRQILIARELNKDTYFIRFNPGRQLPIEQYKLVVLKEKIDKLLILVHKDITIDIRVNIIKLFYNKCEISEETIILKGEDVIHRYTISDKTLKDAIKKLPINITYFRYNGYRNKSHLLCSKCGFEDESWSIIPKYGNKRIACPKCSEKNESVSTLQNIKEDSKGFFCAEGHVLIDYPKNKRCTICVQNEYIFNTFKEILDRNCIIAKTIPTDTFQCFESNCKMCRKKLNITINDIDNGTICDNCENNPSLDKERCEYFAYKNSFFVTLSYKITFQKLLPDDETEFDTTTYVWTCTECNKHTTARLSFIKKSFKIYGQSMWCSFCRERNNSPSYQRLSPKDRLSSEKCIIDEKTERIIVKKMKSKSES